MVKVGTSYFQVLHLYILIGLLLTDYEKNIAYRVGQVSWKQGNIFQESSVRNLISVLFSKGLSSETLFTKSNDM